MFLPPLTFPFSRADALRRLRTLAAACGLAGPVLFAAVLALQGAPVRAADEGAVVPQAPASGTRPSLTVTLVSPQQGDWPLRLVATGNIAAWQEAVIGTEAGGLRLQEVRVNVGDRVKRGQVLALLQTDTLQADRDQTRASLAEAEAMLAEARANADRARELLPSGMITTQQANQWLTGEQTAKARLAALKARLKADEVRLAQTRVMAPDDGVISARVATLGAIVQPGQELFRLIRKERLEWRAEVPESDLGRIKPGQPVRVVGTDGGSVAGTVRTIAPTVDAQKRNGLVYVDLQGGLAGQGGLRAGMFARGEFQIGSSPGLTLPQTAVVMRDGFNYVLQVGDDRRVRQLKVQVGRRLGERVEITGGLDAKARVVASGGGFLADGDLVRVVDGPLPAPAAAPAGGKARNGQPG
jgi:HlyD family secretion protein